MTRAQMKANAREALGKNLFGERWMMAVLLVLVYSVVMGIASSVCFIGGIVIGGPLGIGFCAALLTISRNHTSADIGEMFTEGFSKDFGRAFLIGLLQMVFISLWSLLFVIPGIIKTYSYAMTEFIAVDHPEYDWKECIDESKAIMNGHKWELFVLDLSFIGWIFVGSLVLGIGTLWVAPYYYQTRAEFYRNLIGDYNSNNADNLGYADDFDNDYDYDVNVNDEF